jgi:hypothetical protein
MRIARPECIEWPGGDSPPGPLEAVHVETSNR